MAEASPSTAADSTNSSSVVSLETPRRRLWWRLALGTVITGGLLLFLTRYVEWQHIVALGRRAHWTILFGGLGLYAVLCLIRAARFVLLAPKTPFPVMTAIAMVHNFLLRVMPMRTGELGFAFLVRRAGTATLGQGLLGLLLLRMLDSTVVILLFGIMLALNRALYRGDAAVGLIIAGGLVLLGVAMIAAFPRLLRLGLWSLQHIARLLRLHEHSRVQRGLQRLQGAIESHAALSAKTIAAQSALTVVHWLVNYWIVLTVLRAVEVPISFAQAVLGGTATTVAGFLPIAGIGSFGALEAGWALGFALVGLAPGLAVATSFLFSLVTFVYSTLLASLGWLWLSRAVPPANEPVRQA